MARLNLDHNEFLDFIAILLFDMLKDDEFMSGNERFNKLREVMVSKGLKNTFFDYYLKSSSESRKEYKRFKKVLDDDSMRPGTLFIYPNIEEVIKEIQSMIGIQLNEEELMKRLEERGI